MTAPATIREAYNQADALGLGAYYAPGDPSRFTFACPKCGQEGTCEIEGRRPVLRCSVACGEVYLNQLPLTSDALRALRYSPKTLDEAAQKELPWLIEPILCRAAVTLLAAPAGAGKSMIAGGLTRAIQTKTSFVGCRVRDGGEVTWLDGEQGPHVIGKRMSLLGLSHEGLNILDASTLDVCLIEEALIDYLKEQGAAVLIVDSHRVLNPGKEENDSGAMTEAVVAYQRIARKANVAVLVLHHSGRMSAVRGSSAIDAAVDLLIHGEPVDGDPSRLKLRWIKARLCETPAPTVIAREFDENDVARWTSESGTAVAHLPAVKAALTLLESNEYTRQAEIAQKIGKSQLARNERLHLARAINEGILTRDDDRMYRLPPPPPEVAEGGGEAEVELSLIHI